MLLYQVAGESDRLPIDDRRRRIAVTCRERSENQEIGYRPIRGDERDRADDDRRRHS